MTEKDDETDMSDNNRIHDTETCDCEMCRWAARRESERECQVRGVEAKLEGFRVKYGDEAVAQVVDRYFTERAIY